jgi:hypothetical protein
MYPKLRTFDVNNLIVQNNDLSVLQTIAKTAHSSGLYNVVGGEAKILMILLAAHDLGIKPTIALNGGIWNIQGKIEISARLMTSMIRRAGHSISIVECNAKICTLKGKRADNGDEIESTFSIDDANRAGLTNRDVWKKYAEDMLYARALSRLARRLYADVIGTAYVEGEIRDAETIDITPKNKETPQAQIEEIPLTDKEEYDLLLAFTGQYPDEKSDDIELYLAILKDAWKKPIKYVVERCRDHEKFMENFAKWKVKNGK